MAKLLLICAHPDLRKSRLNKTFMQAADALEHVHVHDLYQHYPHFDIDIAAEQALLAASDTVVFLHPIYWYSCPALLKEWFDTVLQYGFAYGDGGDKLAGKQWLSAISTGGSNEAYSEAGHHFYEIEQFMLPFERTAHLCGMDYLSPFISHDAVDMSQEQLAQKKAAFINQLTQLRDANKEGEA